MVGKVLLLLRGCVDADYLCAFGMSAANSSGSFLLVRVYIYRLAWMIFLSRGFPRCYFMQREGFCLFVPSTSVVSMQSESGTKTSFSMTTSPRSLLPTSYQSLLHEKKVLDAHSQQAGGAGAVGGME